MAAVGKLSVLWQTALIAEDIAPPAATSPNASLSVDYTGARSACDLLVDPPTRLCRLRRALCRGCPATFGNPQSHRRAWQDQQAVHEADLSRKWTCPSVHDARDALPLPCRVHGAHSGVADGRRSSGHHSRPRCGAHIHSGRRRMGQDRHIGPNSSIRCWSASQWRRLR